MEHNSKFKAGGLLNTYVSYSKQISKSQYLRHFCVRLSIDTNNLWTSFFTDGMEQIIATKPAYRCKPHFSRLTDYNKRDASFNVHIYSHSFHIFMYLIWLSGDKLRCVPACFSQHMTVTLYKARLKWCQIFKLVHPSTHAWSMEATYTTRT